MERQQTKGAPACILVCVTVHVLHDKCITHHAYKVKEDSDGGRKVLDRSMNSMLSTTSLVSPARCLKSCMYEGATNNGRQGR